MFQQKYTQMKRNMMPSIGTEQNMTISTLTRMEIMKIFKLVHLPLYFGKRSAADTPRKSTKLNTFHTQHTKNDTTRHTQQT